MKIGVISDTHGLLRPEVLQALQGVDHILHGGDIGNQLILEALTKVAPATAIRGNIDLTGPCSRLPETELIELGSKFFYLIHSVSDLDLKPDAAGIDVVISGHSHKPGANTRNGVLYLNPGSAGPRRFSLPISLAFIHIEEQEIRHEILQLPIGR